MAAPFTANARSTANSLGGFALQTDASYKLHAAGMGWPAVAARRPCLNVSAEFPPSVAPNYSVGDGG